MFKPVPSVSRPLDSSAATTSLLRKVLSFPLGVRLSVDFSFHSLGTSFFLDGFIR